MDEVTARIIYTFIIAIVVGVVYNLYNYYTKNDPGTYEPKRAISTVLFGILVGCIGAYVITTTGIDIANLDWMVFIAGISTSYYGGLAVVNKFVDWLWERWYGVKLGEQRKNFESWVLQSVPDLNEEELKLQALLPKGTPYYRKMNETRRHNMVEDQLAQIQQMVLSCVDEAEAKITWRYAIQAGAWIYLIEYGVLTGAKHYFEWQTGSIEWKPIKTATLETIRSTGKFPEYSQLI